MWTALKNQLGSGPPRGQAFGKKQLRHDRLTALVVLVVVAAVMTLVIWLASFGGATPHGMEYWPIMP